MLHFPENCKYVLDSNSPDYIHEFGELVHRQEHLSKLESKIHKEGEQNFVGNRKSPRNGPSLRGKTLLLKA
ncbi:inovirus Gp2 family protein [Escherichia coli]|uniref:YagK/YfjJ domain-containing protein n=1 Tax=Escherichia coli TaxID=562 RepID=UPI0009890894|nr:inovirus-type Gp2 protein [Escherichia coli]HDG7856976.1 inovirus-type Gp2 protein [Klebsiella quasipneumoniae]HDG8009816.1 inovirus-type Gp2 protein [Klebsiella pneumoniae]EEV6195599.1 inovirus Gp2 family protein [Escherichia coli]EEZ5245917.1 inovirus Gp2 family protein [Escherichia coli]EFA5038186.1 inovirus Gp2 family protein [Escherichia coli]